ncbi:MAG: S8 family serine peptidase [Planctomycetes bacterium]|nr:S8 family serine peptidase [Planctomycetota bacterium]
MWTPRFPTLCLGLTALLAIGSAALLSAAPLADLDVALAAEVDAAAGVAEPQAVPNFEISAREPWNELPAAAASEPGAGGELGEAGVGNFAQAVPADPNERISVLVHFAPVGDRAARPVVRQFAADRGAYVKYEYDILPNVINVRNLTRAQVEELRGLDGVVKVEEDYEIHTFHNDSMPLIRALQSQITGAGFSATGAGIRACVIDTGIDSNSIMYSTRIDAAAGWDFVNNDSNPEDDNGHGSHVAGTVLGGNVSADFGCVGAESMQGVAPAATLIGIKVLNASGSGSASNIIAGINRCASTSLPGGQADVINMSLGGGQFSGTCDSDTMAQAVNNAVAAGVVVVAAAGNNGFTNAVSTPACASGAIAVAATYDDTYPSCEFPTQTSFSFCLDSFCFSTCTDNSPAVDSRCCFSNRSSKLDVAAPGCIIFSDDSTVAAGNGLVGFCGTSQASPHVAGLAALLLDANPSLTPAEVRTAIRGGAIDLGAAGFDTNFGYGRIDAINSLALVAPSGCNTDPECDDGLFCNGAETCVGGTCQAGTAPNCADAVACTTDTCNETTDSCDHTPNNAACDDGLFCNGAETCHVTLGCQAGGDPCPGLTCDEVGNFCVGGAEVWMSFTATTTVPGVGSAENEDIVARDEASGNWRMVFDGSDVGLSGFVIDGMAVLPSGDILLSFTASGTVAGMTGGPGGSTTLDDSDIVRFVPTSLGPTTAGSFVFYFDGSDVGLSTNNEDIDAIAITSDGRLVISTIGSATATGASAADTDLLVFNATSLGATTAGSFAVYFDGSDVGLSDGSSEDVDAAGITSSGSILLSTIGTVTVTGVSGANEDVLQFTPTQLGGTTSGTYSMFLDLSALGISTAADVGSVERVE